MNLVFFFAFFGVACTGMAFTHRYPKIEKALLSLFCFCMVLLIGLRASTIGNDTQNYITIFHEVNRYNSFFTYLKGYEYGYVLLMRFIGLFTQNAQVALLIVAAIGVIPYMLIISEYSVTPWYSFALFFLNDIFFSQMNIVRQGIALGILLLAYPLLSRRKYIGYGICFLLAFLFHTTAIVVVLLMLLSRVRFSIRNAGGVLCCFLMAFIAWKPLLWIAGRLFPLYTRYFSGSYFNGSGWLASLFNLGITVLLLCCMIYLYDKAIPRETLLTEVDGNERDSENIFAWSLVLMLGMQVLAIRANILDRIASYFSVYLLLLLPCFTKKISNRKYRIAFQIFVLLLFLAKFLIVKAVRPEWNRVLPYYFFFQV